MEKSKKKCGCLAATDGASIVKPYVLIHWKKEEPGKVTHFCKCRQRVDMIMGVAPGRSIIHQYDVREKCEKAAKTCTRVIRT